MLKHSTEPRTLTQHASFVEQPSIESLLTCIDCKIADDSYPETARPLHCRLHVDIQEAAKDGNLLFGSRNAVKHKMKFLRPCFSIIKLNRRFPSSNIISTSHLKIYLQIKNIF